MAHLVASWHLLLHWLETPGALSKLGALSLLGLGLLLVHVLVVVPKLLSASDDEYVCVWIFDHDIDVHLVEDKLVQKLVKTVALELFKMEFVAQLLAQQLN